MNILEIENLSKQYGNIQVLDNVSFIVEKAQIFGFLGPNGAGKSTTIKIVMDFLHHDGGAVRIFDKDAHEASTELKDYIGYVPAEPVLYPSWTVDEHIRFTARLRGDIYQKADDLKKLLELDGKKKVKELSTGNQQKLAITLALAPEPKLLILDEPTRGLDPLLRATLHDLLREYKNNGGTILLSSHDLSEVEELCDKVVIIHKGKIVQDTTVEKLQSNHQHKVKVTFTDEVPDFGSLKNINNIVVTDRSAAFAVNGSIDGVVKLLAKYPVSELEVTNASLEDIFREIYQ